MWFGLYLLGLKSKEADLPSLCQSEPLSLPTPGTPRRPPHHPASGFAPRRPLTELVVGSMHSSLNRDGHGAQLAALRHDDVQEAPPEARDGLGGLVQAAAVNHQGASEQLAGPGQVIGVAANLYLEQRDPRAV